MVFSKYLYVSQEALLWHVSKGRDMAVGGLSCPWAWQSHADHHSMQDQGGKLWSQAWPWKKGAVLGGRRCEDLLVLLLCDQPNSPASARLSLLVAH